MKQIDHRWASRVGLCLLAALAGAGSGCRERTPANGEEPVQLSHEQTLEWIRQNRAWRQARKIKPILARPVEREELGKEFQTADGAVERAQEGYWLCVGVAGEPWFQKKARIDERYEPQGEEVKQFAFDGAPQKYRVYRPK